MDALPEAEVFPVAAPVHLDRPQEAPATPPPGVLESAHDAEIIRVQPPEVTAAPAPIRVEETALPGNAPQLPRIALELPPDSGLVLVETAHAAPPVEEQGESLRPRRVRPPRVAVADEPLQMVETTHKESAPPAEE
jgi:hypothetical protein